MADDSAAEVSFASLEAATRAHAKLDAAPGKAGRILAQLTAAPGEVDGDDSIIVCVFGLRVDAPKLAGCFEHVLKLSSCAGGPDETRAIARVLAINVLVRVGVPSGELSEADLAGESDEDTKTKKKVVAAYARSCFEIAFAGAFFSVARATPPRNFLELRRGREPPGPFLC